jgi:hypothetical protein
MKPLLLSLRFSTGRTKIREKKEFRADLIRECVEEMTRVDNAVDLIYLALEGKASRLNVPVEQLGPAADLGLYPDRPSDFRVPGKPSR